MMVIPRKKRLFILGLDGVPASICMGDKAIKMPAIEAIKDQGSFKILTSIEPPITVPAWMSMFTGKDPGQLGLYGFRNRKNYSYEELSISTSQHIKHTTLWQLASASGLQSIITGVPLSFPIHEINGCMIADFLAPKQDPNRFYPQSLERNINKHLHPDIYKFDVDNFRMLPSEELLNQIYQLTDVQFKTAEYLLNNESWQLFIIVVMGPDRIHHGFWNTYAQAEKPHVQSINNIIPNYYNHLDSKIGKLYKQLSNEDAFLIVSDHGAQSFIGAVAINQWLIEHDYLKLKKLDKNTKELKHTDIDWDKTQVWAAGGYYARLFLNIKDREPQGIVPHDKVSKLCAQLKQELENEQFYPTQQHKNRVFTAHEVYQQVTGYPPDLFVYFDNLALRAIGSIGYDTTFVSANDTGHDEANHHPQGIFISNQKHEHLPSQISLLDVFPLACDILGIE